MSVARITRFALAGVLFAATLAARPADAAAPSYADFARHPTLGSPALSPDGQHLAVSVHEQENGENSYALAVLHLPDLKPVSRLKMNADYLPLDITWVDNERLVLTTGKETGFAEAPSATGDILAVNIDGSDKRLLYSPSKRSSISAMRTILSIPIGFGQISGVPDVPNGHFYLTVYPFPTRGGADAQANKTLIYDIDSRSGSVKEIGSIDRDGYDFLVHDGVARYAFGEDNDFVEHVYYRAGADQPWTELPAAVVGKRFQPRGISPDGQHLYALGNPTGGADALTVSNLDGSGRRVLASDPRVSIASVAWTPPHQAPFAAIALDGKPTVTYLDDSRYAAAMKSLNEAFPDHFVSFADMSSDGSTILVRAVSDRDPGTYALFDTATGKLRPLYQLMPWLKADQLGERRPFWFKASSGAELGGFITLPPHRVEKNLPTIVLPHGGPIGVQHMWPIGSWDDMETQFLASRGYAVVQVNYRGSGGRGKNFEDAGKLQMGTGMMQDMLDALKWAEAQGYSDPARVCVYGASYGGYSAYFLPVYAPQGTLKCAVAIAGVSDIRVQADRSDTRRSRAGRNFLREAWGMDDPAYIAANSAVDHIDKFNVPVLIVHGEDDPRVPVQNAREMRDALEKAGKPFEYMTRPKEGHGFFKEQNNVDRYEITEKFLLKYLGPGAPVAN
ncbi:MAG: S9 family peptidase [Mizugakiibacter sp.]|uniref:alpha/beta hydrolase family protein n=1 Tax=Mizugakiibacter sp. TaxID=1972610 RepID=UPI0031C5808C|nr:S9 family peptidase [Xanthomonadaceae bacterium]